eukprot:7047043-Ditylum_brightwellii.AAC.1
MGSNIPPPQTTGTIGGAPAIPPMPAFGAGMLRTGGAAVSTAAPNPEVFPKWMRCAIAAGVTPYPNPPARAPGSLGTYV